MSTRAKLPPKEKIKQNPSWLAIIANQEGMNLKEAIIDCQGPCRLSFPGRALVPLPAESLAAHELAELLSLAEFLLRSVARDEAVPGELLVRWAAIHVPVEPRASAAQVAPVRDAE
jgi:hypothetical protein